MKIPLIIADRPMQVIQEVAGQKWRARGAASDEVQNLMGTISQHQAVLKEKERIAQDTFSAIDLDNALREGSKKIIDSFRGETDTENFNSRRDAKLKELFDELQPKNPSNELKISYKRSKNKYASSTSNNISSMKFKVLEENGRIAIGQFTDNAAEEHAVAPDQRTKDIILKRAELEIRNAIANNLVNRVWGENQIRQLGAKLKGISDIKAITAAQNHILENPGGGSESLKESQFWDKVPDEDKPQLIRSADKTKKVFENELKTKEQEAKKAAHDADDEAIYAEIRGGNLSTASTMVDNSTLGPHEQNSWQSNIRARLRGIKVDKDPTEEYDPLTYATVATVVYNSPEAITRAQIFQKIGKGKNGGLTTVQAEHFAKTLKTQMDALKEKQPPKDAVRAKEISSGLAILKSHHGYGTFSKGLTDEEQYKGDVKYQQTMEEFLQWSDANPDKDPSEKLEQILTPIKEEHTKNVLERAWDYFFDAEPTPEPTPVSPEVKLERTGLLPKSTLRPDGTPKGTGWLGELERPAGGISTEISIGVNLEGGPEVQIPLLVPTLTQDEIDFLLAGNDPTTDIIDKAIDHAMKRKRKGLSPFKTNKREEAIAILNNAGKMVNEGTIEIVMDQLK